MYAYKSALLASVLCIVFICVHRCCHISC